MGKNKARIYAVDPSQKVTFQDVAGVDEAVEEVKALPHSIGKWFPKVPVALGTDGFGRSESRAALRRFFEVDAAHIVVATLDALARYDWPGNVRELENAIERAVVVGKDRKLRAENLPFFCDSAVTRAPANTLKEIEKAHIASILAANGWNIALSAKILDIDRSTLYSKIKRYQIARPD